jgi:WD40 repeat protein
LENAPKQSREWAWNKNGWLACATWVDASVRIWNEHGKLVATLNRHQGGVESVSWSPDGDWLASGGGDLVRLWKPDGTAGPVMRGHTDEVYPVAWSPDGNWIASGGSDCTIRLWKPDGTAGPIFRGHQGGIHDIAWSPDSQRIVSASWLDSTLRVWNIESGRTEWQAVLLESDVATVLTPSGQPFNSDTDQLNSSLFYLVEKPDGATEIHAFEKEFPEGIER